MSEHPAVYPGAMGDPGDLRILHLATWGKRFLAFLIDILIVAFAQMVLLLPLTPFLGDGGLGEAVSLSTGSIVAFLYFWLFTGLNAGRTPGKMALRLETLNEVGGPPTMGQAAVDALGKTVFLLLDVLVGLFVGRHRRQRFSQSLVDLVVVRREPQVEQAGSVRFVKT